MWELQGFVKTAVGDSAQKASSLTTELEGRMDSMKQVQDLQSGLIVDVGNKVPCCHVRGVRSVARGRGRPRESSWILGCALNHENPRAATDSPHLRTGAPRFRRAFFVQPPFGTFITTTTLSTLAGPHTLPQQ